MNLRIIIILMNIPVLDIDFKVIYKSKMSVNDIQKFKNSNR